MLLVTIGLLHHSPAAAQVGGVVVDHRSEPLPGALVELWTDSARIGALVTDSSGRFRFRPTNRPTLALLVRRLGFAPLRAAVRDGMVGVQIRLDANPVSLEAIEQRSRGTPCVERDDPAARGLWNALRARYDLAHSSSGFLSDARMYRASVALESLAVIDTSRLESLAFGGGGASPLMRADDYYARRPTGMVLPRFDAWAYPFLESLNAWHFIDPDFGRRNRLGFGVTEAPDHGFVLAFCSRRDQLPYIIGALMVGPDSTLAQATWQFVIPRDDANAGGRVYFLPHPGNNEVVPLRPMAGLFWRRQERRVLQEWIEMRGWRCAGGASCTPGR